MPTTNIAIFVSGSGTNCENIIRYFAEKPEVNDEFAQDNGYDNLEAYKAAIVAELQEAADKQIRQFQQIIRHFKI